MFSHEHRRVVDGLLNMRETQTELCSHSSIAFTVPVEGATQKQYFEDVHVKETEILRLLTETFPDWMVGRFKEHPHRSLFPGLWIADIFIPVVGDSRVGHSLLSLAYYLRWSRQGLVKPDHYNAAACDPRWSERDVQQAMQEADDPVQWVTNTYGDTLEKQFPVLVCTGPMGNGHYLVVAHPEEDACEETVHYRAPAEFLDRLHAESELQFTAATNIQGDERMLIVTWKSKLARRVFEERHPECLSHHESRGHASEA